MHLLECRTVLRSSKYKRSSLHHFGHQSRVALNSTSQQTIAMNLKQYLFATAVAIATILVTTEAQVSDAIHVYFRSGHIATSFHSSMWPVVVLPWPPPTCSVASRPAPWPAPFSPEGVAEGAGTEATDMDAGKCEKCNLLHQEYQSCLRSDIFKRF